MPLDLNKMPQKPLTVSPKTFTFEGTLEELYAYAEPNFPKLETVYHYHALLRDYCDTDDPLHLVRRVSETDLGVIYTTQTGDRFLPTDNSPAWWMHYVTFNGLHFSLDEFRQTVPSIPYKVLQAWKVLKNSISTAGWYVAHIYPVKNGNTYYPGWDREELRWRFLRNVHPCNHFFVPKIAGAKLGEDPQIIAYFAARYQQRYKDVWSDFLSLIDVAPADMEKLAKLPIEIGTATPKQKVKPEPGEGVTEKESEIALPEVVYEAAGLTFKYDLIEPLEEEESFRVVTKHGTVQMTKGEFYHAFSNVVATKSYQQNGVYSYSYMPKKAVKFLIGQPQP